MQKYFICKKCGTILAAVKQNCDGMTCCGEKLTELVPGTTDAAVEKHVPVFTQDGNKVSVTVGEVEHPMTDAHYIEWISIATDKGNQRKILTPADAPKAEFLLLEGEKLEAVFAYCNLHSLWKADN